MPTNEHLTPELFVDLLDGAPVEAERRQHLSQCSECRDELRELEQTLGWLRAGEEEERPAPERRPSRRYAYALWAAAAAAVLVAVVLSHDRRGGRDVSPAAEGEVMLLPPIEEDEDFRLLLALSEESEEMDFLDDVNAYPGLLPPDASELTPGERQSLLEQLAQDMRSSS